MDDPGGLSEISQMEKTNTVRYHLYADSRKNKQKSQFHRNRTVVVKGWGWWKWDDVDQRIHIFVIQRIISEELMYSIVTTVNNTVLQT